MTSPLLQYGRVEDWIGGLLQDGDDTNDLPDDVDLVGSATFEPLLTDTAGGIRVPNLPRWFTVGKVKVDYTNGRISHRGMPYVMLLAPNAELNPTNWKWQVTFDLRLNGNQITRKPFAFALPVFDPDAALVDGRNPTIVHLTTVQPVNVPGSGTGVVQGPRGFGLAGVDVVDDGVQFLVASPEGPVPLGDPVEIPGGSAVVEPDSIGATELTPEVRAKVAAAITQSAADNRYAPLWQPSTAYAISTPVLLPNGKLGTRTAAGTSRATFDATELALWTVETAALPSGGTTGQFLSKTESGADWTNAPAGGSFSNTLTKLFNTTLTASPATGQKVAALASATGIAAGWEVILSSDTGFSERKVVASVAGLNVTFTTNINGNHASGAMVTYSNQPLDADYLTATTAQQVTGSKDFRGPMRFQRPVPATPGLQPYDSFDFVNAVFTSRAQGGGSIVAKAEGDMSAGLIDWIHAGILANSGYLMHMTHTPTSKGTFFGLGVQGDGGGAILIAKDGPKGTGLSIDQKGVVTDPAAYGQYMMQSSRFADMSRWQQMQPGVAPLINLLSAGHTPWPDQRIQNWISSTIPQSNLGYVDASNGQFVWQQPIIADATRPNTAASLRYKGRGTSIQNQMWLDENGPQPGGALDTGTAVRLFAATGQFAYSGQLRMSKNAQGILLAVSAGAQRIGGESMQTVLEATSVAVRSVGAALESQPLAVPTVGALVVAGTPGSTTYGYRVAAVNAKGTTVASATVSTTTGPAALTTTDKITVPWSHVQGAIAYKVYGRTPGSEQLLATVGQAARTVSDAKMFAATTRTVTDVVCTAQNNNITSATAAFTTDDIGRRVQIPGQGYNNYDLDTYITAVPNGTTATLAYSPNNSATGRTATVSSPAYTAVESATAAFTAADVGKAVQISGAAASGAILYGYIEQYISAQRVILNIPAVTSVSGASMTITGGTPALSFVDDGTLTPSGGLPGASAGQTAKIVPWLSQTGNVAEFFDNTLAVTQRVNRAGRLIQKITTAPALADLADGESTQWTDPATGDLKFTSRIGGALKTATITAS